MKRTLRYLTILPLAALAWGCQVVSPRGADAPTVHTITQDNERSRRNMLVNQSRGLLRPIASEPVPADPRTAMHHFEALLAYAADPATRAEAMRRAAYLRVYLFDSGESDDERLLDEALALYRQLLAEHPEVPGNDLALYQFARAQQLRGEPGAAAATLVRLTDRYPQSQLYADAAFRAGELFYAARQYADAARSYARVAAGNPARGDFAQSAQYKLGWSLLLDGEHARAIRAFGNFLDHALPAAEHAAAEAALATVPASEREMVADALRGLGLSFVAAGGVTALDDWLDGSGAPAPARHGLLYAVLGDMLLERERYSDAASAWAAFAARHPAHPRAPDFELRAIAAYTEGGFVQPALEARETFAHRYAQGGTSRNGAPLPPGFAAALREQLESLARHYHAQAQDTASADDFLAAAHWYAALLDGERAPGRDDHALRMHYADALYDGGRIADAAAEYEGVAYDPAAPRDTAQEAAIAAVQAHHRRAQQTDGARHAGAVRDAIAAARRLVDEHPDHREQARVLTRAAEDAHSIGDSTLALELARRVLAQSGLAPELRRAALLVAADGYFAEQDYARAEAAYHDVLEAPRVPDALREEASEQLAVAIYRQGEAARAAGAPLQAAAAFARVAQHAPASALRPAADYDTAAMYAEAEAWSEAIAAFEGFRREHPRHELAADADKWLAAAYEREGRSAAAARAYTRIATRSGETTDVRRQAAWQAARLYDEAQLASVARDAWRSYVDAFPQPLERAQQARWRLAELDRPRSSHWLQEILRADAGGMDELSSLLAARARLAIGRELAQRANAILLSHPVRDSLPQRSRSVEEAMALLSRAAESGFDDVVTAAAFEMAALYHEFARALLRAERPPGLDAASLDEYELLLEDQAYPLEERAIALYERNLEWLMQGAWDEWIRRSAAVLAELVPARYAKRESREEGYASLH